MDEEGNKHTYEVHAQLLDGSEASLCKRSCNESECPDCRKVFHDRHYNPHDNFIGLFKQFDDSTDFIFDGNHRNTDEDGKCNDLQHIVSRHGIENICRNDVDQCLVECLLCSSTGFSACEFGVAVFVEFIRIQMVRLPCTRPYNSCQDYCNRNSNRWSHKVESKSFNAEAPECFRITNVIDTKHNGNEHYRDNHHENHVQE